VSMPASFQGIFSLKPSSNRISFRDVANTVRVPPSLHPSNSGLVN
jgi:Asp-tRNA(Asn)/Glu-tRNA(Gln) amidotransferase A subunit family amidase